MNRLGMIVDISHVSDKTFYDALETSTAPIIASHSSCRVLAGHVRNMTDDMIKALAAKGGVIQINFHAPYLDDAYDQAQKQLQPEVDALRKDLEAKYPGPENSARRADEMRALQASRLPKVSWMRIVEHIDHAVKLAGADHVGIGSDMDGAVMPEGMEDGKTGKSRLTWSVGTLSAGESRRYEYQVITKKAGRLCNRAVVTAGELRDETETCVEVRESKPAAK